MKIYEMEQRSEEWLAIRKGKLTASNAQAISANGKGLETLAIEVVSSLYAMPEESYTNEHIERGIELENQARQRYEIEHNDVKEGGFIELDEYIGCSPDGLVGEEGGIEIKCVNNVNHFKFILEQKIESKYQWQIQMCLLITGRKWWDYISYNPNFEKALVVVRVEPDQKMQEKLKVGIEKGKKLLKDLKKKYEQKI